MTADRVSANRVAYNNLVSEGDELMSVPCFSHTLDKIGKQFEAPELKKFMNDVRSLVSISHETKKLF